MEHVGMNSDRNPLFPIHCFMIGTLIDKFYLQHSNTVKNKMLILT